MANERKYDDQEVRRIFALASHGEDVNAPSVPGQEGLTLSQLQDAGREAGLAPERVARAASALETVQETQPRGKTLWSPTSVGRIVQLAGAVTDHAWELLAAELGHTFGGIGVITSEGRLRQWSNGEVHVFLDPTEDGYRLRMTAENRNAMAAYGGGGGALAMAVFFLGIMTQAGKLEKAFFIPLMLAAVGVFALAANVITLPRWADKREKQMEHIADRAKALMVSSDVASPRPESP